MMFVKLPVMLIPRPLPQARSYNSSNDVDHYEDDVKFEPPSSTPSVSSEGRGSFSSGRQGRPGSLDSGSMEQTVDGGGYPARYEPPPM